MKQLFSCFLSNESLVKVLKQCNREKIFELLAEKNENYNKKMVEFIVEILPTFMNIKLEEMKLDSPLMQVLALRVVEK